MLVTSNVIKNSGVQFGTSGARGLVVDFTPSVCAAFAVSFAKVMQQNFSFSTIAIAIDNRPSSYAMAQACAAGLAQLGLKAVYYGVVPTPALAYKAMQDTMPAIMVTGSHIPFDRNGLKFYRPDGEISKADELAILAQEAALEDVNDLLELAVDDGAKTAYIQRYTSLYANHALAGKHIGIYEHSSAGRDIYRQIFEALGAEVTSLERSNEFVAIDTEAVSAEDQAKAQAWSKEFGFDAIFSTDGDGDRPLIADENGNWLRGDILGLLCSKALNIQALAVPVSCNSAIEQSGLFAKVVRTKIGSPYVIAEFSALAGDFNAIAGFEANGGYLLGSDVLVEGKSLKALPTRDALLPAFALLTQKATLAEQLKTLPPRFTVSDRLKDFATDKSKALIAELTTQPEKVASELGFTAVNNVNTTDGLRITMSRDGNSGDVVHFRPSGNAPELRCYVEAASTQAAQQLLSKALEFLLGQA